jgi:hypothetical protein
MIAGRPKMENAVRATTTTPATFVEKEAPTEYASIILDSII